MQLNTRTCLVSRQSIAKKGFFEKRSAVHMEVHEQRITEKSLLLQAIVELQARFFGCSLLVALEFMQ